MENISSLPTPQEMLGAMIVFLMVSSVVAMLIGEAVGNRRRAKAHRAEMAAYVAPLATRPARPDPLATWHEFHEATVAATARRAALKGK